MCCVRWLCDKCNNFSEILLLLPSFEVFLFSVISVFLGPWHCYMHSCWLVYVSHEYTANHDLYNWGLEGRWNLTMQRRQKNQAFDYCTHSIYFQGIVGWWWWWLYVIFLDRFLFFFTSSISGPLVFSYRKGYNMFFLTFLLRYSVWLSSAGRGKKAKTTHLPWQVFSLSVFLMIGCAVCLTSAAANK